MKVHLPRIVFFLFYVVDPVLIFDSRFSTDYPVPRYAGRCLERTKTISKSKISKRVAPLAELEILNQTRPKS